MQRLKYVEYCYVSKSIREKHAEKNGVTYRITIISSETPHYAIPWRDVKTRFLNPAQLFIVLFPKQKLKPNKSHICIFN